MSGSSVPDGGSRSFPNVSLLDSSLLSDPNLSITLSPSDFFAAMIVRLRDVIIKAIANSHVTLPKAVDAGLPDTPPPPPPMPRPPPSERCNKTIPISPNAKINNPMGILGVLVSHLLIKLGFGYASLVIPLLCAYWGWAFFSKIEIEQPLKISFYALISMLLTSITIAVFSIHYNMGPSKFHYSGVLAGLLGDLFLDMFSIYGSIIFIVASYLMIIRAYFDLDFYKPFQIFKERVLILWNDFSKNRELNAKENEKRKHTNELKSKIKIDSEFSNVDNVNSETAFMAVSYTHLTLPTKRIV